MLYNIAKKTLIYNKLLSAFNSGKLFHAIMIIGDDEVLSKHVAKSLASEVLKVGHNAETSAQVEHKVQASIHPDLKEFGEEKPLDASGAREITSASLTKPFEGDNKVYIIYNFDDMGQAPANILLKTIEEPPAGCYFILLVKNENRVLQTILSRSQRYYQDELTTDTIESVLEEMKAVNAPLISAQSAGSLTRALSIKNNGGAKEVFDFVMDALLNLNATTKFGEYASKLESMKGSLSEVINFFMSVCSDLIKLIAGKPNLVKNKALLSELNKMAPYHTINGLVMILDAATKAREKLDKKINATNIIDQFLFKIVEVRVKCRR